MENKDQVFLIEIDHPYMYSFEDFKNKEEIYVPGIKEIPWIPDENEPTLYWEEGGMTQVHYNFWKEVESPYYRRIRMHLDSDKVLTVPIPVIFSSLKDWELISCLAVLHYSEPLIEYEFYEVGERYGKGEKTVVKYSGRLVKSLFCINEKGQKLTVEDYAFDLLDLYSEEEVEEKVQKYLNWIKEYKLDEEEEEFNNAENCHYGDSYFKNDHYNDSLDMDQQSPEFWDNL